MAASMLSPAQSGAGVFAPTPDDLRLLVLDYLCHNSYSNTARAFVKDTTTKHLDADGDEILSSAEAESSDGLLHMLEERLALGERRKEIRTRLLSGQVDEAIALLNKSFPSVLAEISEPVACTMSSDTLTYIPSTSVDPLHLMLNLHIHAFIEANRTVPLPYYPPGTAISSASPVLCPERDESEQANAALLHRAQNLYSEANRLPGAQDRVEYLKELGQVGVLLAYSVPENSPSSEYLSQPRREAIADQIDSAILYRYDQPIVSKLDLVARQTSVIWSMLHELKYKLPPRSAWPSGVSLSLPASAQTHPNTAGTTKTASLPVKTSGLENDSAEIAPPFDLQALLDTVT